MPRAPSNPKFTVHCFKNLNLSVRRLWTWTTTCLQEPYKCLRDTWVLGAAEVTGRSRWWNSFAPQWDFFPQTHSLHPYYVSVTALPGLGWPHGLSGKKVRERWAWWEGSKPVGKEVDLSWAAGFPGWPKRALLPAPFATSLWELHPSPWQRGLPLAVNQGIS